MIMTKASVKATMKVRGAVVSEGQVFTSSQISQNYCGLFVADTGRRFLAAKLKYLLYSLTIL
jgi:hypothetical protein